MSDVTRLIDAAAAGDSTAAADLLPLVYAELRKLADVRLSAEKPGQTLQATALVHEAYLRLVGIDPARPWGGRGHFFAAAAEAMRRILIESARRKGRKKHGGDQRRVDLEAAGTIATDSEADELLALDDALTELAAADQDKAIVVQLRYFAGLTLEQVAACRGVSLATVKRQWAVARAWLYDAMTASPPPTEV
jgi:RNA polymerase sigma factor (TIGR02999 family)